MEEATIATIVTEVLKPTSGIFDAWLSAKIKRIKIQAERDELASRLNNPVIINSVLERYYRRLLKRVCGITTIAFPLQVLPLTSIYEPLNLIEKYHLSDPKQRISLNIKTLKAGQNCIVVDSAGMGKSTYVKHLTLEILNFTNKIPIYLELRRINDTETLLEKIAKELDESGNDIDTTLLLMLFDQGGYVIILDGYDELSDQIRENIGQQITELAIRCDQNSFILTTRPEINLPEIPSSRVFTIDALTIDQAKSLVRRYDAVAHINIGENLIKQFDLVSRDFLKTPLLIVLLYRTYGFNQSVATKITTFYDEVFNAFYKGHDLSKSGFARPKLSGLDADDFRRLLRCFSFLLSVAQIDNIKSKSDGIEIIERAINLTTIKPISASAFLDDLLTTVPLLLKDGIEIRFIHKSIREFFSAEFIAYISQPEKIIGRIRNSSSEHSFISSFEYLSEINPSLFRKEIASPLARKILTENQFLPDPYIRSLCFLDKEVSIGIWKPAKNPKPVTVEHVVVVLGLMDDGCELWASVNLLGSAQITKASWDLVTKDVPFISMESFFEIPRGNSSFKAMPLIKALQELLPRDKWVRIRSKTIVDIAPNYPDLVGLVSTLLINLFSGKYNKGTHRKIIKVIDEETCKNLLMQVEREIENQSLLEALVGGNNKSNI